MRILKITILLLASVLISSCTNQAPGGAFSLAGVNFSYPSGWEITEQEGDESDYYLSIEKVGFNESGVITLSWFYGILNPEDYIYFFEEEFQQNALFQDVIFSPVENNTFHGINTFSSDYTFSVLSLKHSGVIHTFEKDSITYMILLQGANEDFIGNNAGFNSFESSFTID